MSMASSDGVTSGIKLLHNIMERRVCQNGHALLFLTSTHDYDYPPFPSRELFPVSLFTPTHKKNADKRFISLEMIIFAHDNEKTEP